MTTGQSITERAAQADAEQRRHIRDAAAERREESLTKLRDRWQDKYSGPGERLGLELPERDAFTFAKYATDAHRITEAAGWTWEDDGITFLYSGTHGAEGLHVVVTCPDCGAKRAEHVSSLDELGRLLRIGHGYGHRCRETETRAIAYAIGTAARILRISESELVDEALERHADLIARLRFGR